MLQSIMHRVTCAQQLFKTRNCFSLGHRTFASNRKSRTKEWLRSQLGDHYVKQRHAKGYRARSAFKLLELDKKYNLFQTGTCVVDLGGAPGGWSQVASERLASRGGLVIAVDLKAIKPLPGVITLKGDFTHKGTRAEVRRLIRESGSEDGMADVVLSDMATDRSGDQLTDHYSQINLCIEALKFARASVKPADGSFVVKVFDGPDRPMFERLVRRNFKLVKAFKPKSSRAASSELFLFARGLTPRARQARSAFLSSTDTEKESDGSE